MVRRYYPAILEKGPKSTFGVWFPDFPDCVAAAPTQDEAVKRAESALARAVDILSERDAPLPAATLIENIVIPKGCKFVAFFVVGVEPPDPSERVNIYLSKSMIAQADKRAAELGMSRSSFFGLASSILLRSSISAMLMGVGYAAEPHSKAQQIGVVPQSRRRKKKA